MYCGLWRYKWESWVPRPIYFYYAALMETFRPGCTLHALNGLPANVSGLAARTTGGELAIALLNHGSTPVEVSLSTPNPLLRLRVSPTRLPGRPDILGRETTAGEMPLADWQASLLPLSLDAQELTIIKGTKS